MASSYEDYVKALKGFFFSLAKKAVLDKITASIPWLVSAPALPLVNFLLDKVIGIIIDNAEVSLFFKFVDTRVGNQAQGFEEAITKLSTATPEQREQAENEAIEAYRAFLKLNNI